MTSLEVGTEGNLQPVPYSGQITFTKSGTMSVQAMNPDTNAPDTPYTLNGYEAFYGTVTVDKAARAFVVTVNLIGKAPLPRPCRGEGENIRRRITVAY